MGGVCACVVYAAEWTKKKKTAWRQTKDSVLKEKSKKRNQMGKKAEDKGKTSQHGVRQKQIEERMRKETHAHT